MSGPDDRRAAFGDRTGADRAAAAAARGAARRAAAAEARAHEFALLLSRALIGASAFGLLAVAPAAAALGAPPGPLRLAFGAFVTGFILSAAMTRLLFLAETAAARGAPGGGGPLAARAPAPLGFLATVAVALGAGAATAGLMEASWPS